MQSEVQKAIVDLAYSIADSSDSVRFSVEVSKEDNRRLQFIAKKFGTTRFSIANLLLSSALKDAEKALGLTYLKDGVDRFTSEDDFSEYGAHVMIDGNENGLFYEDGNLVTKNKREALGLEADQEGEEE